MIPTIMLTSGSSAPSGWVQMLAENGSRFGDNRRGVEFSYVLLALAHQLPPRIIPPPDLRLCRGEQVRDK